MERARGLPETHDCAAHAGWPIVAVTHVSPSAAGAQELERAKATPPRRWPSEGDFWRLWLIGTVQFGVRWIEMLAIGIFVYQQTGSALLVTLLTMLRTLPLALFGAFVGAVADRLEGRTVLLLNTLVLLATSATMALLAYTDHLAIWHLAVATFISGTMWSTDMGVRRLMIGRVVGAARMGHAMVFDAGANNISRMAGPAIGGVVLAAWGIHACFALGAMMYLLAVLAAAGIRYRNPVPAGAPGLLLRTIFDAVDLARRDRRLLGILAITLIFNLFAWPSLSLIPVIGKDSLGSRTRRSRPAGQHGGPRSDLRRGGGLFSRAPCALSEALCLQRARLSGRTDDVRHAARAVGGRPRPAHCGHRRLGLRHHAVHARVPVRQARDARAHPRTALGCDRDRADRLSPARAAGRRPSAPSSPSSSPAAKGCWRCC